MDTVKQILSQLLEEKPGAHVVDFGCGEGRLASFISERGGRYTGIDIDKLAIQRVQESGYRAITPDELREDDSFDILLLGNMSGIDGGMGFVNTRKKLKPDGLVFMWDFSKQSLPNGRRQSIISLSVTRGDV